MDLFPEPFGLYDFNIREPGIDPFLYLIDTGYGEGELDTAIRKYLPLL